jgi:uncharacterized membrane protein YcjF (UPF0283 family)
METSKKHFMKRRKDKPDNQTNDKTTKTDNQTNDKTDNQTTKTDNQTTKTDNQTTKTDNNPIVDSNQSYRKLAIFALLTLVVPLVVFYWINLTYNNLTWAGIAGATSANVVLILFVISAYSE